MAKFKGNFLKKENQRAIGLYIREGRLAGAIKTPGLQTITFPSLYVIMTTDMLLIQKQILV